MNTEHISTFLTSQCDTSLLYHSRVHELATFSSANRRVWVKREDESSFGMSGSKRRKYASLLPFLQDANIQKVLLAGGAYSNHLVGVMQLLRERNITFELLIKGTPAEALRGNRLLLEMLAMGAPMHYLSSTEWSNYEALAAERVKTWLEDAYFIPEGGTCAPSLAGAATLALDILENEQELGFPFEHIFIDSGTGLIAGALVLLFALLGRETQLHVVLTAGSEAYFQTQVQRFHQWGSESWPFLLPAPLLPKLYFPETGKSFGSVNQRILRFSLYLAQETGMLCDPVYSAKLFQCAQAQIDRQTLKGEILIIHTGGGTGLLGWDRQLSTLIQEQRQT